MGVSFLGQAACVFVFV